MTAAFEELKVRIGELDTDLTFVTLAAQLRPRMGEIVQWQAGRDVLGLVRKFMNVSTSRPEGVYGPLLIRLFAAFERYVRALVLHSIEQWSLGAQNYDELSKTLANRNLILSGRVLAALETPTDRPALDIDSVVSNLATCVRGSTSFRLNAHAFSATVTGGGPAVIEKSLSTRISMMFGTK